MIVARSAAGRPRSVRMIVSSSVPAPSIASRSVATAPATGSPVSSAFARFASEPESSSSTSSSMFSPYSFRYALRIASICSGVWPSSAANRRFSLVPQPSIAPRTSRTRFPALKPGV